jgi:hypothetical protein
VPPVVWSFSTRCADNGGVAGGSGPKFEPLEVARFHSHHEIVIAIVVAVFGGPHLARAQAATREPS